MKAILQGLPKQGINSIALVPYGFMRQDWTEVRMGGWERDDGVEYVTKLAHGAGMRVLLKPQIWVRGAWPGDIEFDSGEDRSKWFASYRTFAEHYAKLAEKSGADMFCVGVEFSKLSRYQEAWREVIAVARKHYSGPLVYAANWGDEFESVEFWDALDYIGLNEYYPLPDDLDTSQLVATVEKVQRRYNRPVLFPEAGFPSLTNPHREPWAEQPRDINLEQQARCYQAIFEAFYDKPWFQGMYWWKVGTNGFGGPQDGSHTPWGKPAMKVMAEWYLGNSR